MTDQLSIRITNDYQHQPYRLEGRRRRDIGYPFIKGRDARRFVRNVNGGMPLVSPLRSSVPGVGATPVPVPLCSGPGLLALTSGVEGRLGPVPAGSE